MLQTCSKSMQIHKKIKIYLPRAGEMTSLTDYTLVSCIQGSTQKCNASFSCPSERFTQVPLSQIKQTSTKSKWFPVPQLSMLWGGVYWYTWKRWRQDNKTRQKTALLFSELHTYYLRDLNSSHNNSQYLHKEADGIFVFPYFLLIGTSNLPLIVHRGSECLLGYWLLAPWWQHVVGCCCIQATQSCCSTSMEVYTPTCLPKVWQVQDQAMLGRHWPSAGKDKQCIHAWWRTLLAVPCQHRWVPLSLATLFNLVLEQSRRVHRLSQPSLSWAATNSWEAAEEMDC